MAEQPASILVVDDERMIRWGLCRAREEAGYKADALGLSPYEALIDALVAKNLYILTANIAGLRTGGTVSDLWDDHYELASAVAAEVLDIQDWLVGTPVDRDRATTGMVTAFQGDPDHGTTGRSAPRRLERAIRHARTAGIETPLLVEIGREAGLAV